MDYSLTFATDLPGRQMKNNGISSQSNFDIRPAAVKKWISDLPLGSTGESSKLLYHALKSVNTQNNNIDQH